MRLVNSPRGSYNSHNIHTYNVRLQEIDEEDIEHIHLTTLLNHLPSFRSGQRHRRFFYKHQARLVVIY